MFPLNTLIKSWKIQNIGATKHFPVFKIFFNERNYGSVMRILVKWLSQGKMNMLLFLRNKNYRIYLLQMASVNKAQKLFILLSLEFGDLSINEDYNSQYFALNTSIKTLGLVV